jgi:predicted nucleotide-binding protein
MKEDGIALQGALADAEQRSKMSKVFIVHGRDNRLVNDAELLIRRFGLSPIILRNIPNAGRTVIEKFEQHADVGVAIILLTPDDVGALKDAALNPRARQNVIWEWGYLVARLGRQNVICLYKAGVELPSDLHGLVWTEIGERLFDSSEEIRRELVQAGCSIKTERYT